MGETNWWLLSEDEDADREIPLDPQRVRRLAAMLGGEAKEPDETKCARWRRREGPGGSAKPDYTTRYGRGGRRSSKTSRERKTASQSSSSRKAARSGSARKSAAGKRTAAR